MTSAQIRPSAGYSSRSSTLDGTSEIVSPALQQDFRVGAWIVRPGLNRLQRANGEESRHLEPRLIHLLSYLAANSHRVLSRDELVQELWPRVIVNENSLTRAISELRKQLQLSQDSQADYIETIPKKGYRLLAVVQQDMELTVEPERNPFWTVPLQQNPLVRQAGWAALCLSLVTGFWLNADFGNLSPTYLEPVLLSDEVMNPRPGIIGAEMTLSTMDQQSYFAEAIETPVVSNDESQYAYIQHDHTGSTIFLGALNEMDQPAAIFHSLERLFNLAWSPLGNSLLFAKQQHMTTSALFSDRGFQAELYSLDLDSFEARRLVEEPKLLELPPTKSNLT
ncbi:MAG: winged helix-turn-helix domain-containing protein [Proteobacteria bacterium]|nr:winged helix-turn-helix domain-containing protein [Pseudomonadota bacterium]